MPISSQRGKQVTEPGELPNEGIYVIWALTPNHEDQWIRIERTSPGKTYFRYCYYSNERDAVTMNDPGDWFDIAGWELIQYFKSHEVRLMIDDTKEIV